MADDLIAGQAAVGSAAGVAQAAGYLFSSAEVAGSLSMVDELIALAERARVALVAEGLARGSHTDAGLRAHHSAAARCPGASRAHVADLVMVAQGVRKPGHTALAEQVTTGKVSVSRAARLLRALERIRPAVDETEYDQAVSSLLSVATAPRFTDRDLRRVSDHLLSVVLPERDHEVREQSLKRMRGVNESSLADGSLTRFVITCDPEGAATVRSVLTSPLAAPAPDETGVDERTPTQRRYDALLTVLRRGVAGADHLPTSPKAVVMVTMRYDVITRQLAGTGTTDTGEVLSPGTARRIACDADLIPTVLGTQRELLDLGRARRLVTLGQRRALHHRDRGCTFPGCSTPAPWCDAHHVIHWSRGGASDLGNYALLCGRHHTLVHDRDHTAEVTIHGVRWHL